ncbi:MAG: phage tail protein [Erythrobacter sp.]
MATLVLSAIGTAIGGPIGGAIGAIIGQQADQLIFGNGSIEGPRLQELSVTTSSYGSSIGRLSGRMRASGTVIWSTDLIENSDRSGGGKGQPSTTTYSYSASFAVALASSPIAHLGRIWADGNLLRGETGDLKAGGELRFYQGHGDDPVDPIIAADKGSGTPAFRDCAYVVFEDLQLEDFGNRIPALTFEIFSEHDASVSISQIAPQAIGAAASEPIPHMRGFLDIGGPLRSSLSAIDRIYPLSAVTTSAGLEITPFSRPQSSAIMLSEILATDADENEIEHNWQRISSVDRKPQALQYYDEERDYQPGVQRAFGKRPNGAESIIDIPATLTADGARQLINASTNRSRWRQERVKWLVSELDPDVFPGAVVQVPDATGYWRVQTWEWHDRGVELSLERLAPNLAAALPSDSGAINQPSDLIPQPTILRAFETPSDGSLAPHEPLYLAAASSVNTAWRGASLFVEEGTALVSIGSQDRVRSVMGELVHPLSSSDSLLIESANSMVIELSGDDQVLADTDIAGLAQGRNRIMVGREVLQFLRAEAINSRQWALSGLLRGRAGTEAAAIVGHPAGTPATLLDDRLSVLDSTNLQPNSNTRIAAIGLGDTEPAYAQIENFGLSRQPLTPVHPTMAAQTNGSLEFGWTRRSRGQWLWHDGVEVPLIEEQESYEVGFGPVPSPFAIWNTIEPNFILTADNLTNLITNYGQGALWVRQNGTFSNSAALHLTTLV